MSILHRMAPNQRALRALLGARQSRTGEGSLSLDGQLSNGRALAAYKGWPVVGEVADRSTPGTVPPNERKELGPWLTEPAKVAAWDVLVFFKIDRASRDFMDFMRLCEWAERHDKIIVFTDDPVDTSTELGNAILAILAIFAQLERRSIKQRMKEAKEGQRDTGKYMGGQPNLGYRPSAKTKYGIEIDPKAAKYITLGKEIAIACGTYADVARAWNSRGFLTPRGKTWTSPLVLQLIHKPVYRGYVADSKGVIERGKDGKPRRHDGGSLITDAEYRQMQESLGEALRVSHRAKGSPAVLSGGVSDCIDCKSVIYKSDSGKARTPYYECSQARKPGQTQCKQKAKISRTEADAAINDAFLYKYGDRPVIKREWVTGSDNTTEIGELRDAVRALVRDKSKAGPVQAEMIQETLNEYEERLAELGEESVTRAGWRVTKTSRTVREVWQVADDAGKNKLLKEIGAKILLGKHEVVIELPEYTEDLELVTSP